MIVTVETILATLPPLTLAVEDAVHGRELSEEVVACRLHIGLPEVRRRLDLVRPATAEERARREECEAAARAIVDARKAQEAAADDLAARIEEVRKEAVAHGESVEESQPQGVPVAAHEALKGFRVAPDGSLLAVAGSRHAHGCDYLEPSYRRVRGVLAAKLRELVA